MKNQKMHPIKEWDGKSLNVNFNPDKLAKEVNDIDFPKPNVTPEPDSAITALRDLLPVDKIERMRCETGSEHNPLFEGMDAEKGSVVCDLRGGVSSLFGDFDGGEPE